MRKLAISSLLYLSLTSTGYSDVFQGLAWPDPSIPIPDNVRSFIHSECVEFQGWSEETVVECVSREMYGYRAVVTMLTDSKFGERAAERYRGCTAGLGKLGGRFHRRKAECVSTVYKIVWRFEYSEEVFLSRMRKAELSAPASPAKNSGRKR